MKRTISLFCLLAGFFAGGFYAEGQEKPDGPWSGKLNAGGISLNLTFNFASDGQEYTCTMDSPDQGVRGIEAEIETLGKDTLAVSVPMISASYRGRITRSVHGMPERIEGVFSQAGADFPLMLEPGLPAYNRPQTPAPPYPYRTEDVSFMNGDVELAGTLTWPEGYDSGNAADIPVVLMVSGSGQQNRDEELFGHKPFAVIADWLARHGTASLRYDDRGTGKSTGNPDDIDIQSNMEDALAGLEYLESLGCFGKTGVLGHSEGGSIAFMLAGLHETDFIISLAGAAVSGRQIVVEQNRRFLELSGIPDAIAENYCNILDKILGYKIMDNGSMKKNASVDSLIAVSRTFMPSGMSDNLKAVYETENRWMDSFIAFDPQKYVTEIDCPVFAANGSLDCQVIAETNLGALKEDLPGDRSRDRIMEYDGLNHLFQHCRTGNPMEYPQITETFSPEVLSDISEWLQTLQAD